MALRLNGTSSSYIDLGTSSALSTASLSFACWIKADSVVNAYSGIVTRFGSGYYQFFLKSSGQLAYYNSTGVGIDPGTATLSTGTWYHVGWSQNISGTFSGYVNGISDATQPTSGSLAGITGNTVIGQDTNNAARPFGGSIANAAIWNVALTAADFVLLASGISPLAVEANNLAGYWPLQGSQGALDRGPNGLLATLYGVEADNNPPYLIPYQRRILSSNSTPTLNPDGTFPFGEGEMPALQVLAAATGNAFSVIQDSAQGYIEMIGY